MFREYVSRENIAYLHVHVYTNINSFDRISRFNMKEDAKIVWFEDILN